MTDNRYRPSSPPGRRYGDPRASASMSMSSSFDPARSSFSSQPRSVIDNFPTPRHNSVYSTQPIAQRQLVDDTRSGGGQIVRTEYAVRPRNNSTVDTRRPVSTLPERRSSPPRVRPAIVSSSARDDSRSLALLPAREERYLVPATSASRHHQRHASATRAEQERLLPARVNRQPEYHRRGGYNAYPTYASSRGPLNDEGFSYTTPKEQFLSEPSRAPQRRDSTSRRERPVSMMLPPEYRLPARRDTRDPPPPASSRALDRIERSDPPRHTSGRSSDTEDLPRRRHSIRAPAVLHHYPEDGYSSNRDDREMRPPPRPRQDRLDEDDRIPKHRHRDERERDPGRDLPREPERVRDRDRERERDKDRERDRERDHEREKERLREPERSVKPRSRDSSPEHSGLRKGITAAAVGAAGVAAGAAIKSSRSKDNEESESEDRKERKHRRRRHHTSDEQNGDELAGRIDRDLRLTNGDRDSRRRDEDRRGEDVEDDEERRERKKHSRKHRDRSERENESDTTEDHDGKESRHRRTERERDEEPLDVPRHNRDRALSRDEERDVPLDLQQRTLSPGEDEDDRPRKVQLVDPAEKREDFKPKGILKKPREVPFPEDPNPTREGVAPLKDAQKDGVPANARWTKIKRQLVNPEALEKAHMRYEERDDYVIILRVVSREEIMKLAEKTQEIRETRERQWQTELAEKKRRREERGEYSDESSDDYSDDDRRPVAAIEQAPPPAQGLQGDPRVYFAQQQQQQQQYQREEVPIAANGYPPQPPVPGVAPPQQIPPPVSAYPPQSAQQPPMPVPDIRIEPNAGNYSSNV